MNKFSEVSKRRRGTLHPDLQMIVDEALEIMDFSISCGYRDEAAQDKACSAGRSKKRWPKSKHNKKPSKAVDVVPYPVEWPDKDNQTIKEYARRLGRFHLLAGIIMGIAHKKGIKMRWGGTFSFGDYGHHELG